MSELGNKPAFPEAYTEVSTNGKEYTAFVSGMSIRTYASIQAMKGILGNENIIDGLNHLEELGKRVHNIVSILSIKHADALIKALEEK